MGTKFKGIKTAKEYRRGELTKDILRLVGAGVVVGGASIVAPNMIQLIDYFNPTGRTERQRLWKAIKYLEARNRLVIEEQNGEQYVRLTNHGRVHLDENSIWELAIDTPRRWDKKWRLVMFDFPTRYGNVRHAFRLKLEDMGFKMYQRSVFIYPHECVEEVHTIARWYGVDEYIRYIVAVEINDMRTFIKEFDLL
jgi:CRISPR-associated endonuclease Cas2